MDSKRVIEELELFLQYRKHKNSSPYIEFHHNNDLNKALEAAISDLKTIENDRQK